MKISLLALPCIFLGVSSVSADTRSFTSKRPPSGSKVITAPTLDTAIPSSTNKLGVQKLEVTPTASASTSPEALAVPVDPEPEQEAEVFPPPNAGE